VEIHIDYRSDEVAVVVRDDGQGGEPAPETGHGLAGMRERVELIGGRLRAGNARDGRGFEVAAILPTRDGR
jgi:signal transduction histidine kinase